MVLLLDKNCKDVENCIIRVYRTEQRAKEDFDLLNDSNRYILKTLKILKTPSKKKVDLGLP